MLRLWNTATRRKEPFTPIKKNTVGLYTCGPTVYHFAHIGNIRSFLFSDVLRRTLELEGYRVKQVINITDVGHLEVGADIGEEKIEVAARRERKTVWQIADFYTKSFLADLKAVNIKRPTATPRATKYIREQIALVRELEKKGFTYRTSDGIYFDTAKFPQYGGFAGVRIAGQEAGARVEIGEKLNPTDFALWKFSPRGRKREMEWKSPWGVGFPGWHLECSAMSRALLGQPFDIHTGGADLAFPHHANEIAQSSAAYGKPLAHVWLHSEFVVLPGGAKMAKSERNFTTIGDLIRWGHDPLAYRYLVLNSHYRSPLTFSDEALNTAEQTLVGLRGALRDWPKPAGRPLSGYADRFLQALEDDLNIPQALAVMWEMIKSNDSPARKGATLLWMDRLLGLDLIKIVGRPFKIPPKIQKMLAAREKARVAKNFAAADEIRRKIEEAGYLIEDTPTGPRIRSV
ncbi:cysteine--tRNA ligase [Candidatus Uhrbacteria bacterium RIFCSPHIGHO2_02_FULL_57_19]|uniref:Cysteine--tRNA ligase n=1 Tax=Candidatus Uhrbacteria bacterium RIFCSPHIGHO2_02_FULL_57_19 TaxID=1802391 RepID=A0A1F7U2S3_9BACT|nr:MAG: cysteine--tRNA ligase [Candidatus Uhrbacteria bacterium RIFCSPHIGHO2_02_FULL_57_19]